MASTGNAASEKWLAEGCGEHYEGARFASARARARDIRCVLALLDLSIGGAPLGRVLDVPCGSGRLTGALAARAERYVGADISPAMLQAARPALDATGANADAILADGLALPFAARSFDAVVACRWLHHLRDESTLQAGILELVRVSRGVVIASFWDECSLPGWRRRLGLKSAHSPGGRTAKRRGEIAELLENAGAEIVAWRATLRFVSQQTFVVARARRVRA